MKFTLNDAKTAFHNGVIKSISFDFFLGEINCVCHLNNGHQVFISTTRGSNKSYKSIDSILKDYKFITSLDLTSFKVF